LRLTLQPTAAVNIGHLTDAKRMLTSRRRSSDASRSVSGHWRVDPFQQFNGDITSAANDHQGPSTSGAGNFSDEGFLPPPAHTALGKLAGQTI